MGQVSLDDIEAFLADRKENRVVHYDLDEQSLSEIHDDHLFEALSGVDPVDPKDDLQPEFESRDDVYTATELVVDAVGRTFAEDVFETLPRDVLDSYIICTACVLEDELDGVYDQQECSEEDAESEAA